MFRLAIALTIACAASSALADHVAANADGLRDVLMNGQHRARVESLTSERNCNSSESGSESECTIDVDGLSILQDRGFIREARHRRRVKLEPHGLGAAKYVPEIDWDPLGAFRVFSAGTPWGVCLEFTHTGITRNGDYQRWISVMLVPSSASRPAAVAHRFIGYWAGCDSLTEGASHGEVVLPTIEPLRPGAAQLHLVWNHCTPERCTRSPDHRTVHEQMESKSGALLISSR